MTSAHRSTDGRIFRKECTSLAAHGYDVYLVAPGETRRLNDVNIVGVTPAKGRLERMTKTTKSVFKKALEIDAEVYHLHDPELIPWGVRLAKRGKRVVFDSHENYLDMIREKEWIPAFLRTPINKIFNTYFIRAMKNFAAIIIVTPYPDDRMERIHDLVVRVSNFPDETSFAEKENITPSLFFAGGITPQWNHETVLDALAELEVEDIRYTLCGPIEETYLSKLKSHPSWSKVDYKGVIPFESVQELLTNAGIGLALLEPSSNTFGQLGTIGNTKLFEEMAAGLPVICTDFVLWEEIHQSYPAMLCICPNDKDELVGAIRALLDSPDKALEMGRIGQQAVFEKYSWRHEKKNLLDLYETVLSR